MGSSWCLTLKIQHYPDELKGPFKTFKHKICSTKEVPLRQGVDGSFYKQEERMEFTPVKSVSSQKIIERGNCCTTEKWLVLRALKAVRSQERSQLEEQILGVGRKESDGLCFQALSQDWHRGW